jgi:hypothetical protein
MLTYPSSQRQEAINQRRKRDIVLRHPDMDLDALGAP